MGRAKKKSAAAPALASASEVRAIAERALALGDWARHQDEWRTRGLRGAPGAQECWRASVEALRFCAAAAGLLRDASLVDVVADALGALEGMNKEAQDHVEAIAEGLAPVLAAGARADDNVRGLARSREPDVRAAVALGLQPLGEAEIAVLDELASDAIASVRAAARASVAAVREVQWWRGKFSADPLARLSPAETASLAPRLARLGAIMDGPWYALRKEHGEELADIVRALPDALAVDFAEQAFLRLEHENQTPPAVLADALGRPGGPAAFVRLVRAWAAGDASHLAIRHRVDEALPLMRDGDRLRLADALIRFAAAEPPAERAEYDSAAGTAAEVAALAWPDGADVAPLIDAVLAIPVPAEHGIDWVASRLSSVLRERKFAPGGSFDRCLDAMVADYPAGWEHFRGDLEPFLGRAPPRVLRAGAERAAASESEAAVRWGLEQLLGRAHNAKRDPPRGERARALLSEPRLRKVVMASDALLPYALPTLRTDLREGRLDADDARAVVRQIDRFWGGAAAERALPLRRGESDEAWRAAARKPFEPALGPEDLRGPPTPEEWRALRAARARTPFKDGREALLAMLVLPEGPWHEDDRAVMDTVMACVRGGEDGLAPLAARVLAAKATPEDLPLFAELAASDPEDAEHILSYEDDTRERLGLPPRDGDDAAAAAGAGSPAGSQWMDEPDDDA